MTRRLFRCHKRWLSIEVMARPATVLSKEDGAQSDGSLMLPGMIFAGKKSVTGGTLTFS